MDAARHQAAPQKSQVWWGSRNTNWKRTHFTCGSLVSRLLPSFDSHTVEIYPQQRKAQPGLPKEDFPHVKTRVPELCEREFLTNDDAPFWLSNGLDEQGKAGGACSSNVGLS